ncbi:hypothetical protein AQPE_0687 [Aquipluma nitroreducens]|uniref:WG repeat-containing protein n=1 Tax=Aquipluma nitroreducens TaxID=2010828 RepID=A0A5K7S4X0_9BACT|nr:WG repeat-containing protein [Aquipluma nitroreducens]BBE16547.1 hypothetical protein AQPE_0687 [Aquipluma nitroreducens]
MKQICIILIILTILTSCYTQSEKSNNRRNSISYERISDDNSWGFIDNYGDTIIPLGKYKFLNPIDEEGMIFAQLEEKCGYIDIKQNILIPFEYDDLSVFSEDLAPAKKNGKYGFIDRKGEVIIPFQYDEERYFYKSGLSEASKAGKWGFINKKGEQVVPIQYSQVDCHKMETEFIFAFDKNKWAIFNNKGKQLTDFIYDEIYGTSNNFDYFNEKYLFNGLLLVRKGDQYRYLNRNLQIVADFGYFTKAEPITEYGFAIVKKENYYGIIDSMGKIVIPCEYSLIEHPRGPYQGFYDEFYAKKDGRYGILNEKSEFISDISYDSFERDYCRLKDSIQAVFIAKKGNRFGVINKVGKVTLPVEFEEINLFEGNSFTIAKRGGLYGLINSNGDIKLPFEYKNIISNKDWDYIILQKDKFYGVIDKQSLKEIFPMEYEEIEQCFYDENNFIAKKNSRYGIITRTKKIIIPFEYDKISNWVEYGPKEHFVIKDGKEGLISREGKIVIPTVYDKIFVDNDILIKVRKNGVYGTINWKNEIVHPIQYEQILWEWPYLTDRALDTVYVEKSGKYFATDITGKVIIESISNKLINDKFGYKLRKN